MKVLSKYDPKTIVQDDHIMLLNIKNFEHAIKTHSYMMVYVYSEWCKMAEQNLNIFKDFSKHLYYKKSKIKLGLLHADTPKKYSKYFKFLFNPTVLFYHNGELLLKKAWYAENVEHAKHFILYGILIKEEPVFLKILKNQNEFEQIKNQKQLSLIYVGDDHNTTGHQNFLDLVFTKKSHTFSYIRIQEGSTMEDQKLYMYRKKDQALMEVKGFPDWWESLQWIYHHSNPHVLDFPQPALTHVLEHNNKGLWLIFEKKNDLLNEKNQKIEIEFQQAAEKLYKEYKCSICFLEQNECKKFISETLHGDLNDEYPKILISVPIHDFRGDFIGLKFNHEQKFLSKNIINFAQNLFTSNNTIIDVFSEEINEDEQNQGKLVGRNIFKEIIKRKQEDSIVFFYRKSLEKDNNLFEEYLELKNHFDKNVDSNVKFYHYNVEKNAFFQDLINNQENLPAIRVFQKNFHNKSSKFYQKIESFLEILMFLNDQLTEDYSQEFQEFQF